MIPKVLMSQLDNAMAQRQETKYFEFSLDQHLIRLWHDI